MSDVSTIGFATGTVDTDVRQRSATVPTDEGDHEKFSHYVDKDKLTEAMVMGTPVVALCGKVWVPSRAPEKFPVCPDCKEIWESIKDDGAGDGRAPPSDPRRRRRPPPTAPDPGLARACGLGHGDAAARLADRGDGAVLRRARRATSSPSPRPAPARRPSRCRWPPSCSAAALVDRITIVAPTEHLKLQWAEAAARAGIPIDPTYAAGKGKTSQDYVGIAVTYAGVAVNPLAMRIRTERFKTLVILDEVHHAGDALSWGEGVREAFEPATGGWR